MCTPGMPMPITMRMDESGAPIPSDGEPPQQLVGYRTNDEWNALLAQASAMIERLEQIDDPDVRAQVFGAMDGIDAIHRESLHRLVRLFKEGVLEQVVTDPAIRTLMGMYDLLPPEQPGCGKVWDFMPKPGEPEPFSGKRAQSEPPVAADRPPDPPHWTPAPLARPLESGESEVCLFDEGPILIANVRGDSFAAEARCPHHDAPMTGGTLSSYSWACPLGVGCIYDIRSGARLGGGEALICLPVRRDGDRLLVGFGVPFEPGLPAF